MTASPDLRGRVLLVTGATGGLGSATARAAGAAGAEVILLGRGVKKLEALYDALTAAGAPEPAIVPLDLEGACADDYADIADRIAGQCGRLDGLIHAAGLTGPLTALAHYPPLEWLRVMQVNLNAPLLLTQACLPLLREAGAGRVVFIGDRRLEAYWGAYGVAKAGTEAMAQILADELAGTSGVHVDTIHPGPMRTRLRARNFPAEPPGDTAPPEATAARILALFGA